MPALLLLFNAIPSLYPYFCAKLYSFFRFSYLVNAKPVIASFLSSPPRSVPPLYLFFSVTSLGCFFPTPLLSRLSPLSLFYRPYLWRSLSFTACLQGGRHAGEVPVYLFPSQPLIVLVTCSLGFNAQFEVFLRTLVFAGLRCPS